jgi:hypothetical protein
VPRRHVCGGRGGRLLSVKRALVVVASTVRGLEKRNLHPLET